MWGSLISAGAGLLGGLFGNKSAERQMDRQMEMQKEFAQEGIRWRVADAKAAGIHPLAALGAQTHSYAPMTFSDSLGPALASAGQDIGRAIDAGRTSPERSQALSKTVADLSVQRMGLENELLSAQIARVRQAGHPPPIPTGGPIGAFATNDVVTGGNSVLADGGPWVEKVKTEVPGTNPGSPQVQPGTIPDYQYTEIRPGEYIRVPSVPMKQAIEDNVFLETDWNVRNRLGPYFDKSGPPFPPKPGYEWTVSPAGTWTQVKPEGEWVPTWYGGYRKVAR